MHTPTGITQGRNTLSRPGVFALKLTCERSCSAGHVYVGESPEPLSVSSVLNQEPFWGHLAESNMMQAPVRSSKLQSAAAFSIVRDDELKE